jgi:predicted ATP-grasp superfamily ATP-dependent carboligase
VEGSQYSHTLLTVANCFFIEYQSFQSLCSKKAILKAIGKVNLEIMRTVA